MGYSRIVVVDGWVMVSGTTSLNYETMSISEDVAQQAEQAFLNMPTRWQRPEPRSPMSCASAISSSAPKTSSRVCPIMQPLRAS